MDDARLQTVWQQRQPPDRICHFSQPLAILMKYTLGKRVKQLHQLADIWDEVIPEDIAAHTALEGFRRGILTVLVDSAAHRFQLQTLLNGGLTQHIQQRSRGAINKIRLMPGQFHSVDLAGQPRYEF